MFAVGDKVVYPMHGAGVVKTIEKRERDGQSVDYLILAMLLGEMKVMVPVDSVERVGLRHVIENDDIDAVEKVLEEEMPETDDEMSMDATRQFTPEEMEELQRRVEAGNKHLEETQKLPVIDDSEADDINLNETQTFKLNIEE